MEISTIKLKEVWAAEQTILDEIDRVCSAAGLRYSLAYGTLIGAVRHKGFIPWDDDIDIMMPREDYEKLKSLWSSLASGDYVLDDCDQNPDAFNNFSKIRKDHTTFLQFEAERSRNGHKGFFVDIFPADRVAPSRLARKIQFLDFALNLLFNRRSTSGTGGVVGFAEQALLSAVPKKYYHKLSLFFGRRSRRWNSNSASQYVMPSTIRDCKVFYPADLFERLERIEFEGKQYFAVKDRDTALRKEYGDYMVLPPEEERIWKHHPILIDFHRNYEELTEDAIDPFNTKT